MNRPSLRELECFVAVAEELNFSRAASRLNLSQPPLTRQIQSLEARLGVPLVLRNTRVVSLTPAGRLFLSDARDTLTQLDAAAHAARRAAGGEVSRLRLSFVGALLDEALVDVLRRYRQGHPLCQIHLTDLPPAPQLEAVGAGTVDVAFIGVPPRTLPRNLQSFVWRREPLRLVLPADHRMHSARVLRVKDLRDESWVMVSREAAPAFRRLFTDLCNQDDFRPKVVQESDRVAAVLTMVAASQGVSLLPASVEKLIGEAVVFRPIGGRQPPVLEHTCVVRRSRSTEVGDFLKILNQGKQRRGTPAAISIPAC